jgi:hypothetical protein
MPSGSLNIPLALGRLLDSENYENSQTFNESLNNLIKILNDLLDSLESNLTYKFSCCIKSTDTLSNQNYYNIISESIIITKNSIPEDLAEKIKFDLQSTINRYSLEDNTNSIFIIYKEWLSHKDFWGQFSEVENIVNQSLVENISKIKKVDKDNLLEYKKVSKKM